jgi:hypothetical protein
LKKFSHVADELNCLWAKEAESRGYGYPFADGFADVARMIYEWRKAEDIASAVPAIVEEKLLA